MGWLVAAEDQLRKPADEQRQRHRHGAIGERHGARGNPMRCSMPRVTTSKFVVCRASGTPPENSTTRPRKSPAARAPKAGCWPGTGLCGQECGGPRVLGIEAVARLQPDERLREARIAQIDIEAGATRMSMLASPIRSRRASWGLRISPSDRLAPIHRLPRRVNEPRWPWLTQSGPERLLLAHHGGAARTLDGDDQIIGLRPGDRARIALHRAEHGKLRTGEARRDRDLVRGKRQDQRFGPGRAAISRIRRQAGRASSASCSSSENGSAGGTTSSAPKRDGDRQRSRPSISRKASALSLEPTRVPTARPRPPR